MMSSEIESTARLVRASGDDKLLDRICDVTRETGTGAVGGVKMQRNAATDRLVRLGLVKHLRGHMLATGAGFSVSTRIIVMRAQARPAGPGHWRG